MKKFIYGFFILCIFGICLNIFLEQKNKEESAFYHYQLASEEARYNDNLLNEEKKKEEFFLKLQTSITKESSIITIINKENPSLSDEVNELFLKLSEVNPFVASQLLSSMNLTIESSRIAEMYIVPMGKEQKYSSDKIETFINNFDLFIDEKRELSTSGAYHNRIDYTVDAVSGKIVRVNEVKFQYFFEGVNLPFDSTKIKETEFEVLTPLPATEVEVKVINRFIGMSERLSAYRITSGNTPRHFDEKVIEDIMILKVE